MRTLYEWLEWIFSKRAESVGSEGKSSAAVGAVGLNVRWDPSVGPFM